MNREEWGDKKKRIAWLRDWMWDEQLDDVEWDDLPDWVRRKATTFIGKGHVIKWSYVRGKVWGPDDTYLVVSEIQIMESDGFADGDDVEVTIRKIEKVKDLERR